MLRPDRLEERREGALARHENDLERAQKRAMKVDKAKDPKAFEAAQKCVERIAKTVERTTANIAESAPHRRRAKVST